MDYLADNVIGRIPPIEELSDVAQGLVSLQGIRAATDAAQKDDAGIPITADKG